MIEQSDRSNPADEPDSHWTTVAPGTHRRHYDESKKRNEAKVGDSHEIYALKCLLFVYRFQFVKDHVGSTCCVFYSERF